jgi:hypothetical protein
MAVAAVEDYKDEIPASISVAPVLPAACQKSGAFLRNWHDPTAVLIGVGPFHSAVAPSLPVEAYLWELLRLTHSDQCTLVLAWVYLDRFLGKTHYPVCELTHHRLVLAALVVAHLWLEDDCYSTSYLSKCGGVCPRELARLVHVMCAGTEWRLWVSSDTYVTYRNMLGL